jgi:hypothetical protein
LVITGPLAALSAAGFNHVNATCGFAALVASVVNVCVPKAALMRMGRRRGRHGECPVWMAPALQGDL